MRKCSNSSGAVLWLRFPADLGLTLFYHLTAWQVIKHLENSILFFPRVKWGHINSPGGIDMRTFKNNISNVLSIRSAWIRTQWTVVIISRPCQTTFFMGWNPWSLLLIGSNGLNLSLHNPNKSSQGSRSYWDRGMCTGISEVLPRRAQRSNQNSLVWAVIKMNWVKSNTTAYRRDVDEESLACLSKTNIQ